MKRIIIWLSVVLAIIILIVWGVIRLKNKPLLVEIVTVQKNELQKTIRASGELIASAEGRIFAPVTAKIINLSVLDGMTVTKGQVVAEFDSGAAEASLEAAKLSLATAVSNKKKLEEVKPTNLQLEAARALVDQQRILLDQARANFEAQNTVATRDVYEAAKVTHKNALVSLETLERSILVDDEIRAANQAVISAQKSVNEARDNFRLYIIAADRDGVLVYTQSNAFNKVGIGETVTVGRELFQIISSNSFYFAAEMEGEDLGAIAVGREAQIELDGYPDDKFIGTINLIENEKTLTSSGGEIYLVHLSLDKTKENFRDGLVGKATFVLESKKDVLTLPIETIIDDEGEQIVYVYDNGKARRTVITTGIEDAERIEVVSSLNLGVKVISGSNLKDVEGGKLVKIKE